jgi:hypothetical protein
MWVQYLHGIPRDPEENTFPGSRGLECRCAGKASSRASYLYIVSLELHLGCTGNLYNVNAHL